MTFYNTTETNPNKTDKNKTITISKDGNISGVNKLINDNITFSNNLTVSNKDNIKINGTKLFDLIYPIGAIYTSTNSTSPATLFGGTWEQIKDKFLYTASSDSTKTGGASTVTLDIKNIPSHNHTFSGVYTEGGLYGLYTDSNYGTASGFISRTYWNHRNERGFGPKIGVANYKLAFTPSGTISNTGEGKSFSIMPPYYKVYCWRRTAL